MDSVLARDALLQAVGPDLTVYADVETIIALLQRGEMVILIDDESRENEGDLVILAEHITPQAITFMATKGCGLICLALSQQQADRMALSMQPKRHVDPMSTNFTVSIEAVRGVSSGISAADRAETVRVAVQPDVTPADVATPGHIFPIIARPNGTLERAGHTEATVDFARLAGAKVAAGVICEVMKPDGTMARLPELERFAREHGLKIGHICDLIAYRQQQDKEK